MIIIVYYHEGVTHDVCCQRRCPSLNDFTLDDVKVVDLLSKKDVQRQFTIMISLDPKCQMSLMWILIAREIQDPLFKKKNDGREKWWTSKIRQRKLKKTSLNYIHNCLVYTNVHVNAKRTKARLMFHKCPLRPSSYYLRLFIEARELTWSSLVGDLVGQFRTYHTDSVGNGTSDPALEARYPIEGLCQLVGVVVHLWSWKIRCAEAAEQQG